MKLHNGKAQNVFGIVRWICIIPGGVLCGFLALFPLHWILYFTLVEGSMIQMSMESMAPIERFLSPAIFSIIFVYAGARIAPKKQLIVSIVLFAIGILARALMVFIVSVHSSMVIDTTIYGLARLVFSGLAGGIGVFIIYLTSVQLRTR